MNDETSDPLAQRWTDEGVWDLVSVIFDLPEDAADESLYWHDAMQGTTLLMAALFVLADEFDAMDDPDDKKLHRPALVKKIVKVTMSRSDEIRDHVMRVLLSKPAL